ncbi:adenylate kinase isoenzyme 5-like isoform X5 [Portunus trituberculatus]|uniref:adenylate kinase isoenzyme 5-like isoform X5 n=1 Tax=Portunus trituberculatus TaxID=210409 RepID=UPI001E1CF590|nr:adenylate kinase isoenzyme 5-like isoform X5 [Portunus trituberculatus]
MQVFSEVSRLFKMGICLDTGQRPESLSLHDLYEDRSGSPLVSEGKNGEAGTTAATTPATMAPTGPTAAAPTETITGAPVIFFLGGPGSGKMTHAQNLADIHEGYRHINLTVVISEYIKENDLGSPQSISASIGLALLAREMHLSPRCKGYLVSGYPRHLDDVHHYNDKLGNIDGAILLDWRESTLLNNLEAGARMGSLMLEAAKKELTEFTTKVLPVCEYYDNLGMLYVVSGERSQEEVFRDVQRAHSKILRSALHPPPSRASVGSYREYRRMAPITQHQPLSNATITAPPEEEALPPCIFFMGGPGSDKWRLMSGITYLYPGWACVGVGQMLRDHVARWKEDPESYTGMPNEKVVMVHNLMKKGELVPQDLVLDLLQERIKELSSREGIVLVGFPRDIIQAQNFEEKFHQIPPLLLIDCSELELGRNLGRREWRLDDNVAAARRRLAIYREVTLPMLKAFDEKNRLKIIDGDADWEQVERETKRAIYVETQNLARRGIRSAGVTPTPSPRRGLVRPSTSTFPSEVAAATVSREPPAEDPNLDQPNGPVPGSPSRLPDQEMKPLPRELRGVVTETTPRSQLRHELV